MALTPLTTLAGLRDLALSGYKTLSLDPLRNLRRLRILNLDSSGRLTSLRPLAALPGLQCLDVKANAACPDLSPLAQARVRFLSVNLNINSRGAYGNLSCRPLAQVPSLGCLSLVGRLSLATSLYGHVTTNSPGLHKLSVSCAPTTSRDGRLRTLNVR